MTPTAKVVTFRSGFWRKSRPLLGSNHACIFPILVSVGFPDCTDRSGHRVFCPQAPSIVGLDAKGRAEPAAGCAQLLRRVRRFRAMGRRCSSLTGAGSACSDGRPRLMHSLPAKRVARMIAEEPHVGDYVVELSIGNDARGKRGHGAQ